MTVGVTQAEEIFDGNGSQTVFDTGILAYEASTLRVYLRNKTTQVYSLLTQADPVQYTVSNLNDAAGVNITLVTAPTASEELIVQRAVPFLQELDIQTLAGWDPNIIELQLDRIVLMIQDVNNKVESSFKRLEAGDSGAPEFFNFSADGYLFYDASENEILAVTPTEFVLSVNGLTGNVTLDPDDLDDSATTNKFISAAELSKLAGIETGATADQSASEIAAAYASQVARVSAPEVAAGSETSLRTFAPSDVYDMIIAHAPAGGGGDVASVNGQTGTVVLDADDISDSGTTNRFTNAAAISKLAGIESGATADQTGAEIEGLLDTELANTRWKAVEVPAGGTIGQVLSKVDGTDYNVEWATVSGGGGAVDSVNGLTGVVVLDPDDLDDTATTNKFTTAAEISKLAGIESGATADQTGAEIEALLDTELANTRWKAVEVPAGGSSGQALVKASATDFDLTWFTPAAKATVAQLRDSTDDVYITPAVLASAHEGVVLTDGATVDWDMETGINFVLTLGGNRTLNAPTNGIAARSQGLLYIVQDATGGRTLTWNAAYKFGPGLGGSAPTLSTGANAVDIFSYVVALTSPVLRIVINPVIFNLNA